MLGKQPMIYWDRAKITNQHTVANRYASWLFNTLNKTVWLPEIGVLLNRHIPRT
jgi:hypothetical protein